jgi:CHAT domain-containing protein
MKSPELTLAVQNDYTVWARREDGAEARGKFVLDNLHRSLINIFMDWLNCGNKISRRQELEAFGALLYRTLFDSNVDAFFKHHQKSVQKDGQRLRIQLSFEEHVDDLASIPWEYLYSPDTQTERGFFLATTTDLVLSRYMPLNIARKTLAPTKEPLRVLIVVSKPQKLNPIISEPIIETIEKLAGPSIVVDKLKKPTIDKFLNKIAEFKPHVLHLIGHGRFIKLEKRGEIALLSADEATETWVRDRDFTDFFDQKHAIPHLVFLHLCEGGVIDFDANYAGLAPQLVRMGIQAVVAMQYPVSNKHADVFSQAFYSELAKGEPVDNAVQVGRWSITLNDPAAYDNGAFGVPVLYMRSRDGIIRSPARSVSRRKELRVGEK